MFEKIKKVYKYLTEGIWQKREHEYNSKFMRWLAGQLKVFIYTITSYGKNQLVVRSASLTFYTVLAIVPLLGVVFGVTKALGFSEQIELYIERALGGFNPELSDWISSTAQSLLEKTKGGLVASIGLLILMWSVINVFMNVEDSFNYIWEVRKKRGIARKLSDYVSVLIFGPIVLVLFSMVGNQVEIALDNIVHGTFLSPLLTFLKGFIPFVSASLVFTLVYIVMPNTKVKFMPALKAGVVTGVVFVLVQMFYSFGQSSISRYNDVYGAFALLPLFLIWLNLCWQIIMFGAELSFGYQNIDKFEYERDAAKVSYNYRRQIMLLVMHRITLHFIEGREQLDSDQMASALNIPVRIARDTLFELEQAGLLISVDDEKNRTVRYYPARDVGDLKVYDVIRAIETHGLPNLKMKEYEEFRAVSLALALLDRAVDNSDKNILLRDIKVKKDE